MSYWTFTLLLTGFSSLALANESADTLYVNGNVITLNDSQAHATAVAVRDGRIVAIGSDTALLSWQGKKTKRVDLKGRTLLPGFIDAHGHVSTTGLQAVSANLLPAPDGKGNSIAALQHLLRDYANGSVATQKKMIIGFGYDESQLREKRPPTRQELDAVSTVLPVIIVHQSGHLGVLNSVALNMAGLTAQSRDPEGGVIRREADGKTPNGVLEENAWFAAGLGLIKPSPADYSAMLLAGQKLYAQFGFTTGQDGRSDENSNHTWMALAKANKMVIDIVSYPDITHSFTPNMMQTPWYSRDYQNGFRIGGVKLSLDGSPQGKTAFLTQPYHRPPSGQKDDYRGYPALRDEQVRDYVTLAYKNNWQLLTHANGDAAGDQLLAAAESAVAQFGIGDRRNVMIHAQTVREDQLDKMKKLALIPSFFGMHCYYWGDWHRDETLGPVRADRISPAMSALRRDMRFTQHHDAPVAFPDAIAILDAVVNRKTRSGDILGPDQRLSVDVALKSITLWAAWQHFEETQKGSIEVGKVADFVVLSGDPLRVDPARLRSLRVLETIKNGRSIYRAKK